MENISEVKKCYGCSACYNICPSSAITMVPNKHGFIRPVIDNDKCTRCGLCEKCCISIHQIHRDNEMQQRYFGAKSKDISILESSQSGGIFYTMGQHILSVGGVVYGAALHECKKVFHIRVDRLADLGKLQKSKYAASEITNIFKEVLTDLNDGKKVLFCGTPCQVAGLKTFLIFKKADLRNIYLVDFVCHGVPSPLIWEKYCDFIEKTNNSKLEKSIFRDKEYGWASHFESFMMANGEKIKSTKYRDLFYENLILDNCCFECDFSNFDRNSDITIGDLWGTQEKADFLKDNLGASLVIINSEKGKLLFGFILDQIESVELEKKEIVQPNLMKSSPKPKDYNKFWSMFENCDFDKVLKLFPRKTLFKFVKNFVLRVQNKVIRILKK